MKDKRTLGDYISSGKHEFFAFVKDSMSAQSSNHGTIGNNLGKIVLGVLVCERGGRGSEFDETHAKFFYKEKSIYKGDTDIVYGDFSYSAKVDSENPLAISVVFYNNYHLKKESEKFKEAKKLLSKHGLY